MRKAALPFAGTILVSAAVVSAQTSLTGSNLILKSRGATSGTTLSTTGYLGTYLTVPAGGATLNFNVNATGSGAHMNFVIADTKVGFNVNSGAALNYVTPNMTLPAGTYLVRAERDYNNGSNASFTVNNLSVNTVSGGGAATFSNSSSSTNALAAANTYINHYRKGNLELAVQGVAPGTQVQVRLTNSAFKFGTAVPSNLLSYLAANPAAGSTAQQYQQRLLENFNSITPENGGKWSESDTANQLRNTDRMLQFADANRLRVRQHNLIWGTQQTTAITNAFTQARSTDPATAAAGKATIQNLITGRINSYIGGVNSETGGSTGRPAIVRATQYDDLDVYNESYHTGSAAASTLNANYWKVLGAAATDGPAITADIYNRAGAAVADAGANTRLFTNEYNVLNSDPDQYAQWYSQHVESIRKAGGRVDGVGVQWYSASNVGTGTTDVNPARAYASIANLATQGLPIELTEVGTRVGGDPATAISTAMTLGFGAPDVTGFTLWGYWGGVSLFEGSAGSALYDANFNITPTGTAYQALRQQWTTDVTTTINADGSITLPNGAFFGEYEVTIRGQKYTFQHDETTRSHLLAVLRGDINNDEALNAPDIDQLFSAAQGTLPTASARFDVNNDGQVLTTIGMPGSDTDYWVSVLKHTHYGDADLDGTVDFEDLVKLAQHYNQLTGQGWADGSFNGDGKVDFNDLVLIAQNYNLGPSSFEADWLLAQSLAPEPAMMLSTAFLAAARRRRRGVSRE